MRRWRPLLLLILPAAALAAPKGEVLREEAFNYCIVGDLPAGWTLRESGPALVYVIDGIPHAYVHLVRARVEGEVDVEARLRERAGNYRFPGAPPDSAESVTPTAWGGQTARLFQHEARLQGVLCRRRVAAMHVGGIWYERIETVYGETTETDPACEAGLRLVRSGFRLLAEPLSAHELADRSEGALQDAAYGYRILKPEGFVREEVDPAADPGCRLAFAFAAPDPRVSVRVRLFEYGVWDRFDPELWCKTHYRGFADLHRDPKREELPAPAVPGAAVVRAELFTGLRDGRPVRTTMIVAQARGGRIFALRLRCASGAETAYAETVRSILASFALDG